MNDDDAKTSGGRYLGRGAGPNEWHIVYNTGESGWGQVIHEFVNGSENDLFVIDYLYDAAGNPRWTLGQASLADFGTGAPHSTFDVQCPGCPWLAGCGNVLGQ